MRNKTIQKGDISLVRTANGFARVLVMNVFREEFEETQRQYNKKVVVKVIERAPKKTVSKLVEERMKSGC